MLTAIQLAVLATIATVSIWFLTVIYVGALKRPKPSEVVLKTIVFVGSSVIAYFWTPVVLPALPIYGGDIFIFIGGIFDFTAALMSIAVVVFKTAQLIYDFLWQKFLVWLQEKVLAGRINFLMPSR